MTKFLATSKDIEKVLTIKQRKFLKLYLETGNGTKSAMAVYNCKDVSSAAALANENLRKLQSPIKIYMESKGIDLNILIGTLAQGLKANKLVVSPTEPDKEVPDHATRHKYLETAARWLEVEPKNSEQPEGLTRKLTIEEFIK